MATGIKIQVWRRFLVNLALCLAAFWVLLAAGAEARPTTPEQARLIVANWIILEKQPLGARLGQQVKQVLTFADVSGPLYYVVYLEPAGLVFVPGDDLVEPIVGFAPAAKVYDPSSFNPLGALVNRDIPGRVILVRLLEQQARAQGREFAPSREMQTAQYKWEMLQRGQSPRDLEGEGQERGLPAIDDVYVAPLVQSAWAQTTVDSTPATPPCYDYYTHWGAPDTYFPCGCVATAMAQVMRKWQHPAAAVEPQLFPITYKIGSEPIQVDEPLVRGPGGPYDWANMPLNPQAGITEAQRQAIGALTHDAGAAVNMAYTVNGSGADPLKAADALKNVFMYTSAHKGYYGGTNNIPGVFLFNMVNPSLDAGHPVLLGIYGTPGGHAIVGDGYGNHWGAWYHHLNMGWANAQGSDAWYNLPTVDPPQRTYTTVYTCVYNIYPSGAGEIISGRVTDQCGNPVAGITVTATGPGNPPAATTDARGIYAFAKVSANSSYTIHVNGTDYADQVVTTGQSLDYTINCGNRWGVNFVAKRPPATDPEYVLYNLGGPNPKNCAAYAINNKSWVAGGMKVNNSDENYHPCVWHETSPGKFVLNRFGTEVQYGELHGLNDNNLAVGYALPLQGTIYYQPIYVQYTGDIPALGNLNVPTTAVYPGGRAFGVNNSGVIVGQARFKTSLGFDKVSPCSWANLSATAQEISSMVGGFGLNPRANRINNAGWIVGTGNYVTPDGSIIRAFLWDGASANWLGPATNSEGNSLNNLTSPTIVGEQGSAGQPMDAVIFNGEAVQHLDATRGRAARGVNNQKQIVGLSTEGAFVYDPVKGMRSLNTLVNEPDWNLTDAYDINDNGEIVGVGSYRCANDFAYLLRPLYTITATAGAGGAISPTGAVKVVRGEDITFRIIPNDGYQIADVVVDGASQGAISSGTFTKVTSNHTIAATFEAGATHTITASAGTGGTITPSGVVPVNSGANQTFTITPDSGYHIVDVKVDNVSQGAITSYTFSNVTANHSIEATFASGAAYFITASAGTGGGISPAGVTQVLAGASQTFTITFNSGYHIVDVKVDNVSKGPITSYTFNNVQGDHTIAATFAGGTAYLITATAGTGGSISPAGAVQVLAGANQAFTITPNSGYQVADVLVDGVSKGAISTYTFTNVTANHTITAGFKTQTACQPFFDHFTGSALGPDWIVKNPDPSAYSVSNSRLHTRTLPGDLWSTFNDYQNLFLIANPMSGCDFQVTIKVLGFNPTEFGQQINLIAYDDDDNYIMGNNCYYSIRIWEFINEVNGENLADDMDLNDAEVSDFYLKLVKQGNTYRQFTSRDGVTYKERNNPIIYGNGSPQYLGFIALEGSGTTATPVPVDIDFFAVERPGDAKGNPGILLLLLD